MPNYTSQWTQQTSQILTTRGTQSLTTNFTFDKLGNAVNTSTQTDSIEDQYNADNRVILQRDWTLGFITTFGYDSLGFLNKQVMVDSLFSDSIKYEYANNEYGEVTSITDYNDESSSALYITNVHRNTQGDPTDVIANEGLEGAVDYQYSYVNGLLDTYTSPTLYKTQFSYNNFGNINTVSKISISNGPSLTESFVYDSVSRISSHNDNNGINTSYSYDNNDNLTTVIQDSDLNGLNLTTQYTYDANDNHIITISPNGHVTTLSYNFYTDDLIEENDGINNKKWGYNQDGSLDSFETKNGYVFNYLYYNESLSLDTKLTGLLFSDGPTSFKYEDKTRDPVFINRYGKTSVFSYDSIQRSKWNKPASVGTVNFFPSSVTDNIKYGYDRMGRPLYIGYPEFNSKTFGCNYYYDFITKNIALVQDLNTGSTLAKYTYQKDGQPVTSIYGNGDTIFYHYDGYNRLDSMWGKNINNQLLYSIGASLDNNGRHIGENMQIYFQGQQVAILPILSTAPSNSYTYEPTRNRIVSTGNKSFVSDGAGNIISSTNPTVTYTWDEYGQLDTVSKNSIQNTYEYDPLGSRKRNGSTYYVVDQQNTGNVVMEATQSSTPINVYVYGNGLVARIDPQTNNAFYYHYDFRGSVIAITDQNGQLVQYYQYDPYGVVYNKGGSLTWTNPFQYVGKEGVQTDDSDLYYMKARYYQPSTGRFLGEDPVWNTNLFAYADDDPVDNIDPDGRYIQPPPGKILPGFPDAGKGKYYPPSDKVRWKLDGDILEWDDFHGEVERYDKNGRNHEGAFDPNTGEKIKEGEKGRSTPKSTISVSPETAGGLIFGTGTVAIAYYIFRLYPLLLGL